jgi:hypothetical protein
LQDVAGWDPAADDAAELEAVLTGTDGAAPASALSPSEIVLARRATIRTPRRRRRRL